MARVVGVHGILNEYKGEEALAQAWAPRLRDGLRRADFPTPDDVDVNVVFYGDLFRPHGFMAAEMPVIDSNSLDPTEEALLRVLAAPLLDKHGVQTLGVPPSVQALLRVLIGTPFFEVLAGQHGERALLFGLRQVRLYLHNPAIRQAAQQRFELAIKQDTRVVVGHSLGSVVAYEALCTGRYPHIRTFVSIGSPLGISPVIFDCLGPQPRESRRQFPTVQAWHNIADTGDLVALVKELRPLFGTGDQIIDARTHNGSQSHAVARYLTSHEVGVAVASGL